MNQALLFHYIISKDGVAVDPSMESLVMDEKQPKNFIEVKSFLVLLGYY